MSVNGRYFIVGCPRSGTTLLQSLLASNSIVRSFPESHFFCNLFGDYEPKRRFFGVASRRIRPRIKSFLDEIDKGGLEGYLPRREFFAFQYTRFFTNLLDRLTVESDKSIWIEKTPPHLHYVDYIERKIPDVRFIHIVRNGADVISSIYELRNKYPDVWDGKKNRVSDCVDRWIDDIKITQTHIHKPTHILVKYGDLIADSRSELRRLCRFMGISFEDRMLTDYAIQAKNVSLNREAWKQSVGEKIQNRQGYKFNRIFDLEQQNYIVERLNDWNLDDLFPVA